MRFNLAVVVVLFTILQLFELSKSQMYHYSNGWNAGGKRSASRYATRNTEKREKSPLELLSVKCRMPLDLQVLIVDLIQKEAQRIKRECRLYDFTSQDAWQEILNVLENRESGQLLRSAGNTDTGLSVS